MKKEFVVGIMAVVLIAAMGAAVTGGILNQKQSPIPANRHRDACVSGKNPICTGSG